MANCHNQPQNLGPKWSNEIPKLIQLIINPKKFSKNILSFRTVVFIATPFGIKLSEKNLLGTNIVNDPKNRFKMAAIKLYCLSILF